MTVGQDHFSKQARTYARHRPGYPKALYDYLCAQVGNFDCAWDCGTGNGQAAVELAKRFGRVIATDPSAAQLARAVRGPNIDYRVLAAEESALETASVDLITVAQALHWFQHERFFAEVHRILRPGGIFAAWCYQLFRVSDAVDRVIDPWYRDVIGPYWPPERRHIDEGYRSIAFPYPRLAAPALRMSVRWSLQDLFGYLRSWSGTQRHISETGRNPLDQVADDLTVAWGDASHAREVVWPLCIHAGRKPILEEGRGPSPVTRQ